MNERIKELAIISVREYLKDTGYCSELSINSIPDGFLKKFSELLITAVMAEVRDEVQYEYDWTIAEIVTERVKKAFGV
jgi:predicted transcriptional regulator